MKRLLETQDASPLVQRAQELIEAADPIDVSHARGERIRRELDRPARSTAASWTRLPASAIAGFVLFFGASSFAALRLWPVVTESEPPGGAAPEREEAHGKRSSKPGSVTREAAAPSTTPDIALEQPSRVVEPQPSAAGFEARSKRPQRSSPRASSGPRESAAPAERETPPPEAAPVVSPATTTNSELVVRAVRALRREGDPALAARLLDAYRARGAVDPLAEEVLALQIEAAVANTDPRAARFAREYLTRYPAGRYTDIARRARADLSP